MAHKDERPEYSDREKELRKEVERQRRIWRPGTDEATLRRAAINALMDKGDW